MSPFSQKLSLRNPETLLAAPQASTSSSDNIATEAEIVLPNMSVPPPNFLPQTAQAPAKTTQELEWERKTQAFLTRTTDKGDNLDKKIEKHLETKSGRKRRTFTDFPVYDDVKEDPSNLF